MELNYFRFCLHAATFVAPFTWILAFKVFKQFYWFSFFVGWRNCAGSFFWNILKKENLASRFENRVYLKFHSCAKIQTLKIPVPDPICRIWMQPSHLSPLNWTGNSELKLNGRELFTLAVISWICGTNYSRAKISISRPLGIDWRRDVVWLFNHVEIISIVEGKKKGCMFVAHP